MVFCLELKASLLIYIIKVLREALSWEEVIDHPHGVGLHFAVFTPLLDVVRVGLGLGLWQFQKYFRVQQPLPNCVSK